MGAAAGVPGEVGLVVFFVIGLLGGAHCLGMCGPLVTVYADRLGGRRNAVSLRELRQHTLFNLGRTLSYAAIGALLGLAGGLVVDAATAFALADAVRAVVGIAVGLVVLVAGAGYALRGTSVLARLEGVVPERGYDLIAARADRWVHGPRILALGAIHGVLPCPILYPAFLYAFARGSPAAGALSLGALGLGTMPTLFLYGTAVGSVSATGRRRLHRALGVAFLGLAALPLSMGLRAAGIEVPGVPVPLYQPLP